MDPPNLLLLLLLTFASTIDAQNFFPKPRCGSTGNFSADSTYKTTLTALLSSISTTNSLSLKYGFFNASSAVSGTSQTLYVIGSCRGDLPAESCRACLNASAFDIRDLCPLQKEAVLYSDNCTVRYSNASIFRTVKIDPDYKLEFGENFTSPDKDNAALQTLLDRLPGEAAGGGSLRKYATATTSVGLHTIYAMTQCTPDLTNQQCIDCLVIVIGRFEQCCAGQLGVRIMAPSCRFRYEAYRFFDPVGEPLPPPPAPPPPPGGKSNSNRTVIIVVATSVSAVFLVGVIVLLRVKRKKQPRQKVEGEAVDEISTVDSLQFDFGTIREATDDFSNSKKLGQGGFGSVYMGQLSNGQEMAVKRLSQNSSQGEVEFKNEFMLLAQLHHRNLVKLLGFCLEGVERLLIYEFVPNSSLDQFIFDPLKRANLNWDTRYKIIMGVARGMLYLHEDSRLRIIHRDLKASNVLLDLEMNPKISDFGMARLFELDQTQAKTNRIMGTYGYMAPEYAMHGTFSIKSDVFSFGVLLLEIVSGQRNTLFRMGDDTEVLISYVWKNWREGSLSNIIDPSITSGSSIEIVRCIHIGLLCVQDNMISRPTMASVLHVLKSHSVTLQVPSRPAFYIHSGAESDMPSMQDYNLWVAEVEESRSKSNQFSKNEVSMTEPYPR
ncbi:putative receptor-like protein kinase At4g00960 [Eucalyptus grandis]|uniref:putative receptor-like protein kinase At4g00960 n=1 Tax=Eucalyptus grandis TaxID=71139 RepID=UPI00192EDEBB|nr:putative receptor-like protein kinase At4g00960 [Eucalyptus grandis]